MSTTASESIIGMTILRRRPYQSEIRREKIVALSKTLDGRDVLVLESGDHVIKGSQIICHDFQASLTVD
jgi:hypothetical protein